MAGKKQGPRPGDNGRGPLEFVSLGSGDNSDTNLEIPLSQLHPRPIRPGELASLGAMWWRQAGAGHRLPAEIGVIVVQGGAA